MTAQLAYCQSSKSPPLARMAYTGVKTRLYQLCYQLLSVEGRAKRPTVSQLCEL